MVASLELEAMANSPMATNNSNLHLEHTSSLPLVVTLGNRPKGGTLHNLQVKNPCVY